MVVWHSVRGRIDILDSVLVTPERVADFFTTQRILGRGKFVDDGYDFEVAISGRRRRVAMLDDADAVIRGLTVSELLANMQDELDKVAVELDGEVLHGPLDIGAVDIDTDDGDEYFLNEDSQNNADQNNADQNDAEAQLDLGISGAQFPDFDRGPMMLLTDMSVAEVPTIADAQGAAISVSKLGNMRVLVSEDVLTEYRKVFPRPSYVMAVASHIHDRFHPTLMVRRDTTRLVWDWSGELPIFEWIEPNTAAEEFVKDELGAGAVARLALGDILNVTFAQLRTALLVEPSKAIPALIQALGLPPEISETLLGRTTIASIPAAKLISPAEWSFADTLAWEFAGEGVLEPSIMKAINQIYIDRPWLIATVGAGQSAIAGGILTAAYQRHCRNGGGKTLALVGAGLLLSAFVRIGTTAYMRSIVTRKKSDIDTWRNMRNWQG